MNRKAWATVGKTNSILVLYAVIRKMMKLVMWMIFGYRTVRHLLHAESMGEVIDGSLMEGLLEIWLTLARAELSARLLKAILMEDER